MIVQEHGRRSQFTALIRDEFMALDVPPVRYLVDGLIIAGSATLFAAREKAGKGLFLIDLAVSVATAAPFLDRAVMQGPVIYCALEENVATIQARVRARDRGVGGYPLYIVRLDGSVEGEELLIDRREGLMGLAELIEKHQPVLVIIDPLREAHSGRENEADEMAPRLRPLRSLAHQTETAILVSHHTNRGSGTFRGSTAIRASFDDELQFTRDDDESTSEVRGSLRAEGRNVQRVVEHIAFMSDDFRWVVTSAPPVDKTPNLRRRILDVLHASDDWLDAHDITAAIPGAALGSVQNELGRMCREKPSPFAVEPRNPTKGHPRRYHGIHKREMPHYDAQPNGVNDEE